MCNYEVDFKHSTVGFSIKHMKLAKVKGTFDSYKASIYTNDIQNILTISINFEIDVASISTNDFSRDTHLISADFFHADRYPKIIFTSNGIEKLTDSAYLLSGELTIRDVSHPIKFNILYNGHEKSLSAHDVYGFTCSSTISRKEYGLVYNELLESGGLLIDEEVEIFVDMELISQ